MIWTIRWARDAGRAIDSFERAAGLWVRCLFPVPSA